jgi:hypothetical protein
MSTCSSVLCCKCGDGIPAERIEALPNANECAACSSTIRKVGFMVVPHKTGSFVAIIDGNNVEQIRLAKRANRRSR